MASVNKPQHTPPVDKENSYDDFEVIDVEDYRSDKLQVFNHQALVMESLRRSIEAGGHEMRAGWFDTKMDNHGNITKKYIEDTRSKFIETVKTSKSVMSCDFDVKAEANIKTINERLIKIKKELLYKQNEWWDSLTLKYKNSAAIKGNGIFNPNSFNTNLDYYQEYMEHEVECYRLIFEELNKLSKRLGFYAEEEFIG